MAGRGEVALGGRCAPVAAEAGRRIPRCKGGPACAGSRARGALGAGNRGERGKRGFSPASRICQDAGSFPGPDHNILWCAHGPADLHPRPRILPGFSTGPPQRRHVGGRANRGPREPQGDGKGVRGPVSRILASPEGGAAISLGPGSPPASNDLPGGPWRGPSPALPIRSFSGWGLPCRRRHRSRGALLPHRFTLAAHRRAGGVGGLFSVALSLASRPVAVSNHPGPRSPDFPPRSRGNAAAARASHAADSLGRPGGATKPPGTDWVPCGTWGPQPSESPQPTGLGAFPSPRRAFARRPGPVRSGASRRSAPARTPGEGRRRVRSGESTRNPVRSGCDLSAGPAPPTFPGP